MVFSRLDKHSGCYQMCIAEGDVYKTAFITPQGLYEYMMPVGLCNAPSAFKRQLRLLFGHLAFVFVVCHPDILVFFKDVSRHRAHLLHAGGMS